MLKRPALFQGVNSNILSLSFARFADALGNSLMFVLLPLYIISLPSPNLPWANAILVSVTLSLYGIVNTILQPLVGILTDRMSRRKPLILGGLIIMGLGTGAFTIARTFSDLLLIRMVQGVGVALTVPASLAIINSSSVTASRGRSMGFYSTLRLLGFAIGPLVGGYLHIRFGFELAFYVGAGVTLLGSLAVLIWVKDPAQSRNPEPGDAGIQIFDREVWNKSIISLGAAMFMMASAYSMMSALENEFNLRLQQTALGFGIAFSALTVSRMIVQTPLGYLSDRVGRKPLIITGLILMAPATVLLGMVGTTLQLTGARALQGITSAAVASPAFALAGDLSSKQGEGRQMSIITTGFFLGISIGPLIAGFFSQIAFVLPFIIGGGMLLVGAAIVYLFVPESAEFRTS
ncbi:MAG: MFS transporter [Anaerolineales bacterium]|nr:MFS transporter [Anaerolineales bacterium]